MLGDKETVLSLLYYFFSLFCHQARDGSGSTAVVSLVTPAHVIVANAGDSRAILIMVSSDHKNSSGKGKSKGNRGNSSGSSNSTKIIASGGSSSSSSRVGVEDKKGAAETMAEALGLRLGGGGERSSGVEEEKGEATTGSGSPAAEAEGGLNDSVRLEDQEEDDDEGCEFEGADKIRELLESMMLGGEAKEGGGGGGDGAREDRDGGGGGGGDGGGGAVMVTAMSRDHTAADDAERERVTAAGGKAFEVPYTEEDGTTCVVRWPSKQSVNPAGFSRYCLFVKTPNSNASISYGWGSFSCVYCFCFRLYSCRLHNVYHSTNSHDLGAIPSLGGETPLCVFGEENCRIDVGGVGWRKLTHNSSRVRSKGLCSLGGTKRAGLIRR